MYCSTETLNYNITYVATVYHVQILIIALFKDVIITLIHDYTYKLVKLLCDDISIYENDHDMEDYIGYHDIRYNILHITNVIVILWARMVCLIYTPKYICISYNIGTGDLPDIYT